MEGKGGQHSFMVDTSHLKTWDDFTMNVVDLQDWECIPTEWVSPLQLAQAGQEPSGGLNNWFGVILKQSGTANGVLRVAARNCFYDVSRIALLQLANHLGIYSKSNATLFQVCNILVVRVLKINTSDLAQLAVLCDI